MLVTDKIYLGQSTRPEYLALKFGNRHGLITGATGTGKTVSLQVLAEGFSAAGVPVFCADIKGDLSGLAAMGEMKEWQVRRAAEIGFADYAAGKSPAIFWDLFGKQGHPVRTTITEMGPLLLARILDLNDVQEGVLNIAFRYADDEGLALIDLKDLRALLVEVSENAEQISTRYGNVASQSVGAVQRALLVLEQQGGEAFFGEKALEIADLMRTTTDGRGVVSILAADELMQSPRLYATFLLWLLSELFEDLPEVGDADKPRLVFFFDEAHLLFADASKALIDKVEQVVKLVRSKGVGVYFITQNPIDIPEAVLAQLSNRVQHALRAYTPREQKAVRVAAETFRPNPDFSTEEVITQLGIGEALVSVLEEKGIPSMVGRTLIRPPAGRVGPLTPEERRQLIVTSPVSGQYDSPIDRESAYEILGRRVASRDAAAAEAKARTEQEKEDIRRQREEVARERAERAAAPRRSTRAGPIEAAVTSLARSAANQIGRALVRGILGSLTRGR